MIATETTERTPVADWATPTITVEQAADALGIGRSSAYKGVATGEIPSVRIGGRIVVPTAAFKRLLGLNND